MTAQNSSRDSLRWPCYSKQRTLWPERGRHILADFGDESLVVYQAYRASIADFAVERQLFGGDFSFDRMSWIKPNFLWMMYRSAWASKPGQERILAIRIKRGFFDRIVESAVPSTYDETQVISEDEWRASIATSDVLSQWDPDHDPFGNKVERRAIQIGLRRAALEEYARAAIVSITDITANVHQQKANLSIGIDNLVMPPERLYRSFM
jgi:hypothetical protein